MQTNVANHVLSEKMLAKFDEAIDNGESRKVIPLGTSIRVDLGCGCQMVEHYNVPLSQPHYERFFVQLCNKHEIKKEEP